MSWPVAAYAAGDRRRHDRQRAAARVAERRPDRATLRDPSGRRRAARSAESVDVEEGDVEVRVEQDRDGVEDAAARRGHADAARARAGHDVRVGHDVVVGDDEPGPDRRQAAGRGRDLERARLGDLRRSPARRDRPAGRPAAPGSGSKPTKTSGSPVVVEPAAEPDGDLGRRRQDRRPSSGPRSSRRRSRPGAAPALRPAGCRRATRSAAPGRRRSRRPPSGRPPRAARSRAAGPPRGRCVAPTDSPMATAPIRPTRTTNGRKAGSSPSSGSAEERQGEIDGRAAADGPERARRPAGSRPSASRGWPRRPRAAA